MKKIILKFEDWLIEQQNREDPIGDLARVPNMQNTELRASRRKPDEHKNWVDIVIEIEEPGHIAVFNTAWQEFLRAKQTLNSSPASQPLDLPQLTESITP